MATVSALGTLMEFLLHIVVILASFSHVEHRRLSVVCTELGTWSAKPSDCQGMNIYKNT